MTGIAALVCGSAVPRRWPCGRRVRSRVTADEPNWLVRSDEFRAAITDGDLRHADGRVLISAPDQTSPGVTTMWCGTIGHGVVELGQRIGAIEDRPPGPRTEQLRLRAGRAMVSLLCAFALVLFVLYASRLLGRGAATVAGVLLATEPFLVGHAGVLHTDALVTLWGAAAVVAYLVALTTKPRDRLATVVAAVSAGLALLTKLNAVPLLVSGFAVGAAGVLVAAATPPRARAAVRSVVRTTAWIAAGTVGVFVVLWPAMWVAPVHTLDRVFESLQQIDSSDTTYFRGRNTTDPGVLYYPVAVLVRATPWLVAGTIVAIVMVVRDTVRRNGVDRSQSLVRASLLLAPVPYLLLIAFTPQHYDRYVLAAFPFMALGAGMVVAPLARRRSRPGPGGWLRPAVGAVALAVATVVHAPYAIAYVDPLVGQKRAERLVLLGWGEGIERLGADDRPARGRALRRGRRVAVQRAAGHLGAVRPAGCRRRPDGRRYEYAIRYISNRQRGTFEDRLTPILRDGCADPGRAHPAGHLRRALGPGRAARAVARGDPEAPDSLRSPYTSCGRAPPTSWERRRSNPSPESLRHPDRTGEATLESRWSAASPTVQAPSG